jgi:S1-C subfamily serine protease
MGGSFMKYLFWGVMSFLALSCTAPSFEVCSTSGDTEEHRVVKTETRVEARSRNATVKIMAAKDDHIAVGTGTIFKYKGRNVVVTAAHVIGGPPYIAAVVTRYDYVMAEVVYFDSEADLAVLVIPDSDGISPIPLRPVPENSLRIGSDTLYSGFPNDVALFTIRGYVMAIHSGRQVYIHSYAWPGASGSSVFDNRGRLVGVISAIGVGTGLTGSATAIEDVVLVVPISDLNFELLDFNLKPLDE